MTRPPSGRRLVMVEVTAQREHSPAYDAYVRTMIDRAAADARDSGWDVSQLSAADLGVDGLLHAADDADAVVIMGGEDIDPQFYDGERGYEGEGYHFEVADAAQIQLVRVAAARGIPVLGICRGHQVINVALGGTLLQHVDAAGHRNIDLPVEYALVEHPVRLLAGSGLGARYGRDHIVVQSAHHQVVDQLGTGLQAVGWAHDGHIEAIEHETLPITGVQWHPEALLAPSGQLRVLLDALADQTETVLESA
ncbi:putative glutamine amidotransferase [Mycetocola sp. CAN_C7]|uniref:gamma-glutamyl-gamma-aminobutyrate hydrolase family protein n=1 Tax=Mycetocola sp. CAN_C7 TaxID=2787724 RepID=UPI0018CBB3B5